MFSTVSTILNQNTTFIPTLLQTTRRYIDYRFLITGEILMTQTSDDELTALITLCGLGSEYALEALYKKISPFLNSYAMRVVRCEALSNEVLQDSFIQIWDNAASYCVHRGKPLTWMCTIVRNRAIDKLRAEKKHLRFCASEKEKIEVDQLPGIKYPELEVIQQQSMAAFNRYLSKLPINEQRSIKLAYLYGYSRSELAEALDTNVNTAKSWLRRGLKHLQRYERIAV